MALTPGARLGLYEIVSALGAGGMGEVYRATDTKLKRQVAIKILPPSLAADPDRLARFQREAEVLASLNHPHIAAIYGLEDTDGVKALVMELVEGEDLAQRIARGPIPISEALSSARQIAEALEAAHEQGIIHRDLKPANIRVRPDGTVKVLDFGLAKAMEPTDPIVPNGSLSPTLTSPAMMTGVGTILGTAAYMSPEQAKGKPVDKRTDVWAFGCVVYEMLTGARAFAGEDVSDTLAFILTKEPDAAALPASTPVAIRRLLRRCLEKDRKRRLSDIADARLEIDDAFAPPADAGRVSQGSSDRPSGGWRRATTVVAAAVTVIAATSLLTWAVTRTPAAPRPQPMRFAIVPPLASPLSLQGTDRDIAISPDGSYIVYRAGGSQPQLMVRGINDIDARPLTSVVTPRAPFISPDSQWVGFWTGSELKKVPIGGGAAVTICRITRTSPRGASWAANNTIVFATIDPGTGLMQVPAGGGEPKVLTTPGAGEVDHFFPSVLPGGTAVLFTIASSGQPENNQIAVLDLATGRRETILRGGSQAQYVDTGHIVYAAGGALRAVRFDASRLKIIGDPASVVEEVTTSGSGAGNFALSRTGTLVYVPGAGPQRSLVWVDRGGREEPVAAPSRGYAGLRISPDATQVALGINDQEDDIWVWDLSRRTLRRLTFGSALERGPIWTPDGRRLIFNSTRDGAPNLYWQLAEGTGDVERLTTSLHQQTASAISLDGKQVVLTETSPTTAEDLMLLTLDGERRIAPLQQTAFAESLGDLSPDGRFLAYQSSESGQPEVYVRPYPRIDDGRWQVSNSGGTRPLWAKSGRELFYIDANGALMSVPVQPGPTVNIGNSVRVFQGRYFFGPGRSYDATRDGQRFLMIQENATANQTATPASLIVVLNWVEELNARWRTPQ